jgi:hypothetical protein
MAYYGTLSEANAYFAARLHSDTWEDSTSTDKPKALEQAARTIDNLNYRGVKNPVYLVLFDSDGDKVLPAPTQDAIMVADATQALEFPRGSDTSVPTQIKYAQWEIALALLDGFDPDVELENLRAIKHSYATVRTTYSGEDVSSEYIMYGIPSGVAWRYLKPYLVDTNIIKISRVD